MICSCANWAITASQVCFYGLLMTPAVANQDKLAWFTVKIAGWSAPISWELCPFTHLSTGCFAPILVSCNSMRFIHNNDKRLPLSNSEVPWTRRPVFDATNGHKNECLWSKSQLNSSQQPAHICVLLERILDFNGLLESAQPSLKLQLKPDYQRWL